MNARGYPLHSVMSPIFPFFSVARTSLLSQNLTVIACSVVLCLMVVYEQRLQEEDCFWYRRGGQALVIVLAVMANLASMAITVSIEKDWVVEICGRDKAVLTGEMVAHSVHSLKHSIARILLVA